MNLKEFSSLLDDASKSEKEIFKEFLVTEAEGSADMTPQTPGVEKITQELSDGSVKTFKFKIIEIWPAPTNFFTVVSLEKPKDELNFWTLFYDNTWYIKKAGKSLINVHVKLV